MKIRNLIDEAVRLRQSLRSKLQKADTELRRTLPKQIHKFAALQSRFVRLGLLVERAEARLIRREEKREAVKRADFPPDFFLRAFVEGGDTLFLEVVRRGARGGARIRAAFLWQLEAASKQETRALIASLIERLKLSVAEAVAPPVVASDFGSGEDITVVTIQDRKTKTTLHFRFDRAEVEAIRRGCRVNWAKVVGDQIEGNISRLSPDIRNAALMALFQQLEVFAKDGDK